MFNGRKVVTICGSCRFPEDWKEAAVKLTLEGKIVLTIGTVCRAPDDAGKGKDGKEFMPIDEETKKELDKLHLDKISMSDEIYVLNRNGYIGSSTRSEISHAEKLGLEVVYRFGGKKQSGTSLGSGEPSDAEAGE